MFLRWKRILAACLASILCISQNTGISFAESQSGTRLAIDNQNIYAGMKNSYARGYVPEVDGRRAVVVLPLIAKGKISGKRITAAPRLGESENVPFVCKNYEKSVRLCRHKVKKDGEKKSCYLVVFSLELKRERYNGTYPVNIAVTAEDGAGSEICQDFTVYVTIRNGKNPGEEDTSSGSDSSENHPVLFAPKVLVDSYHFSKKRVMCGEKFRAKIILRNTSKKEAVRNMLVTVTPEEHVELLSKSAGVYVEKLAAGKTCQVSYDFKVSGGAPTGQYGIGVAMEYADGKANAYTAQGTVKVSARQRAKIGIDPVSVPREIKLGETMELQAQVMNLGRGRLRNVRAVMEAEGLSSSGSAYMGDIEAGASMSGTMEMTAEGLTGDSLYGTARGKVTFYYEDETGKERTQEQAFETSILSPVERGEEDEVAEDASQWWIIMALIGAFLAAAAGACLVRKWRSAQRGEGGADEE
ncbi:MAG: hypothetical protein HFH62_05040 [Lachnospiraceae bacterium]|nr:hypothetical protein [Lachnospiraceae bacterium]